MAIRVGMIGAGAIADDHCQGVNQHPDAEMVAVADISRDRREAVKQKYGMARAYAKWEDLVADPGIDAVAIALPNALHAQVSLAALAAGKHVLLEKPFALNYREAKQVADAAKKMRKVLMLGMNLRFWPEVQSLRTIAQRGDLGEIYHAKAYWYRRTGSPKMGTWFVNKKLAGGGCMLDIGVHFLNNIQLYGTEAGADLIPVKVFRSGKNVGEYEVVRPENVRIPHRYENRQANWLDAILGKDKPICTVEQALAVQKILDGIYESSASGKEVRIR